MEAALLTLVQNNWWRGFLFQMGPWGNMFFLKKHTKTLFPNFIVSGCCFPGSSPTSRVQQFVPPPSIAPECIVMLGGARNRPTSQKWDFQA